MTWARCIACGEMCGHVDENLELISARAEIERLRAVFADQERCSVHGCRLYQSDVVKVCFSCGEKADAARYRRRAELEIERLRAALAVAKDEGGKLHASYNSEGYLTEVGRLRGQVEETAKAAGKERAEVERLRAENAELREAVVDYFAMPSGEKKRAIRLKFRLSVPCDHHGLGRPGCPTCDPRRPIPGART